MPDINLVPEEYQKKGISLGAVFSKTGGIVLILLILSLLFYGGLLFYQKKLQTNLNSINQEITNLESKRDKTTEEAILSADKKLNLAEDLFKSHLYWSDLFGNIEKAVVPDVYFSESKLDFANEKVDIGLTGNAKTYTALAQQMVSFKEDPSVESIAVSKISLSESGGIEFDLAIVFSKSILINKTEENQ